MLARLAGLLAVLVLVSLSGCSSKPPATASTPGPSGAMAMSMSGDHVGHAMAPQWKVGQSWEHHWYFSPNDTTGFMVKAIVVSNGTDGYRLATDDPLDAASHASFYFHDQGVMAPDWSVKDFDGAFQFPWYSFPLTDGKTWTAHEENLDGDLQKLSQDLSLKATAINGTPGAFTIESRTSDGSLRAKYDYQPAIGWFSEYRGYPAGTSDPEHYNVRMVNEKASQGWTGTYYTARATMVLDAFTLFVPPGGVVQPSTNPSFTITSDSTHVMVIPFAFAAAGAADTELTSPDGQHWESYVVADQDGGSINEKQPGLVFVPAVAGDWHCATAGAGGFAWGGGCFAWAVKLAQGTL